MPGVIYHERKSSRDGIDGRKRVKEPESRTAGRIDIFDGGGMGGARPTTATPDSAAHGDGINLQKGWLEGTTNPRNSCTRY